MSYQKVACTTRAVLGADDLAGRVRGASYRVLPKASERTDLYHKMMCIGNPYILREDATEATRYPELLKEIKQAAGTNKVALKTALVDTIIAKRTPGKHMSIYRSNDKKLAKFWGQVGGQMQRWLKKQNIESLPEFVDETPGLKQVGKGRKLLEGTPPKFENYT